MTPNTHRPRMMSVVVIGRLMKSSERFIADYCSVRSGPGIDKKSLHLATHFLTRRPAGLERFLDGEVEAARAVLAPAVVGAEVGLRALVEKQTEAEAGARRICVEESLA